MWKTALWDFCGHPASSTSSIYFSRLYILVCNCLMLSVAHRGSCILHYVSYNYRILSPVVWLCLPYSNLTKAGVSRVKRGCYHGGRSDEISTQSSVWRQSIQGNTLCIQGCLNTQFFHPFFCVSTRGRGTHVFELHEENILWIWTLDFGNCNRLS